MKGTYLTVLKRSPYNYMGRAWFEIFINAKSTGTQVHALDKDHAVEMYNQYQKIKI
jgi:hypothetical protein